MLIKKQYLVDEVPYGMKDLLKTILFYLNFRNQAEIEQLSTMSYLIKWLNAVI